MSFFLISLASLASTLAMPTKLIARDFVGPHPSQPLDPQPHAVNAANMFQPPPLPQGQAPPPLPVHPQAAEINRIQQEIAQFPEPRPAPALSPNDQAYQDRIGQEMRALGIHPDQVVRQHPIVPIVEHIPVQEPAQGALARVAQAIVRGVHHIV